MEKIKSLINIIKTKSVKINLGDRTFRMRLLTLSIFALAVLILLIAIIVLIIVNACSSTEIVTDPVSINETLLPGINEENELEPDDGSDEIEPVDPIGVPAEVDEPSEPVDAPAVPESTDEPEATPVASPDSSGAFTETLTDGVVSESVKVVQQRLVDLYYMDYPVQVNDSYSVTDKFGSTTSGAVKLFQERNNLPTTGDCDPATYAKLMSAAANPYIMRQNDKCNMVKVIQNKLKEKGYLDKVTGFCGNDTITAITNFQKANGLTPDGIAGPGTMKILLGH